MAARNIVYVADYEGGKYLEVERREGENGEFPRVAAVEDNNVVLVGRLTTYTLGGSENDNIYYSTADALIRAYAKEIENNNARVELYDSAERVRADVGVVNAVCNMHGETAFPTAVEAGRDLTFLQGCVDYGLDINDRDSDGATALYYAIENQNKDAVEFLVSHGADVNLNSTVRETSPLALACSLARSREGVDIVRMLCDAGADVNAVSYADWAVKMPVLFFAVGGSDEVLSLLLERGADINAKDGDGYTVLDYARRVGSELRFKGSYDFLSAYINGGERTAAVEAKPSGNARNTLVINAFGGAGAGKTTACFEIAEKLKKNGYVVEYAPEYAKELVWENRLDMLTGSEAGQRVLLEEQNNRLARLVGKVDFIVTDSPLILNLIYNKELTDDYKGEVLGLVNSYNNFNFVVERDYKKFENEGRIHSFEESVDKDNEIKRFLDAEKIYYGTYNHATVDKIVANCATTLDRLNKGGVSSDVEQSVRNHELYTAIKNGASVEQIAEIIDAGADVNAHFVSSAVNAAETPIRMAKDNEALRDLLISRGAKSLYVRDKERVERYRALSESADKPRLFVDMDGTLTVFTPVDEVERLYEQGFFYNQEPHLEVIDAVDFVNRNVDEIEVFVLSAVLSDSKYARDEKNAWLDKYLPSVDKDHRIFTPCGEDKAHFISNLKETDYLLDDYTKNLSDWQPPARGIKLLNGINHTRGSWAFDCLRYDKAREELASDIINIVRDGEIVRDDKPIMRDEDINKADEAREYSDGRGIDRE